MITIQAEDLKEVLSVVGESVSREVEQFSHICLETLNKNSVVIRATDQMSFSVAKAKSQNKKPLKLLIPYGDFSQYVGLWKDNISLTVKQNHVIIRSGSDDVKLSTGQGVGEFKNEFPKMSPPKSVLPVRDFPVMVDTAYQVLNQRVNSDALKGVHAVSKKGKLIVEASDGFQIISMRRKSNKLALDCIINPDGARLMSSLPMPGSIWVDGGKIFYRCMMGVFAVRLMEAPNYPDLMRVLPSKKKGMLVMDKKTVSGSIRRVELTRTDRMRMEFGNALNVKVEARSLDVDNQVEYKGQEKAKQVRGQLPKDIILNTNHVGFLLSLVDDKCTVYFAREEDPVWYANSNFTWASFPYVSVR